MITNKKILLICKESYSFPLFFLAKKLLKEGNSIGAFFIHPEESYYNKSLYNENTFYKFKEELDDVKLFGLKDLCVNFNERNNTPSFDKDYLEKIEKEYTHFKNLNLQITSSQLMTRQYHTRDFFSQSTFNQNLNFLELSYKKVIAVLDEYKPDLILDTGDGELLRTVLNEVAYKKEIPYITIDYPRYEGYKIPTFNLGLKHDNYFVNTYRKHLKNNQELQFEIEYILAYRCKSEIMSNEYQNTITSQYKPNSIIPTLRYLIGKLFYFWNVFIAKGNIKLTRKDNILYGNPIKFFSYFFKVEIKKQLLYRKNKYFITPDSNDKYVYMPLHLIPESTTFVKAPFYIDELNIIAQVSKSLPIGWVLYVKEHQAMLGERSFEFYKKVKKFPNVKLVQLNYYQDPKPWIENAQGVITIAGTSAYEAALLGKPSILFSDVPFTLINGINRVHSFEELPKLISNFGPIDNLKSCAAYIAAVKAIGSKIKLKYLMTESEAILKNEKNETKEFQAAIDGLMQFYVKALKQYNENL